jgi:hypothetical protein
VIFRTRVSEVLGKISQEHVNRSQFCCPKVGEVGRVRPKHKCGHNLLQFTVGGIWWKLTSQSDIIVFLNKGVGVIYLAEDAKLGASAPDLAEKLKWCEVKMSE